MWDNDACGCVCDPGTLACDAAHVADPDLCACACRPSCGDTCDATTEGQESTCACVTILGG